MSILSNVRLFPSAVMVTLCLSGVTGCALSGLMDTRSPLQRMADDAIEPAYRVWQTQTRQTAESVRDVCARDAFDKSALKDLQAGWRKESMAWSYLQSMQPGPVTPVSVRVSYWPDKKDLVGHQVESWLKQPTPSVAELADQSVTLQGLSALEFLLFDQRFRWGDAGERARLCPHVQVIAERQQQLADETLQAWQQEQGAGMRAALPNQRYANENEALAELLKANVSGLEVAHKKLVSALGEKYPQPYLAEYWRSGASLTSARAVIEGSQTLWQTGFVDLVKKQDAALADDISALYSQVLSNGLLDADAVTPPLLSELLKSQEGRQSIAVLANAMKDLHMAFARDVSKVLQLPLGINAHDGD